MTGLMILLTHAAPATAKEFEPALAISEATLAAAIPDRRYVFARTKRSVRVWDAGTGDLIADVKGKNSAIDPVRALAVLGTEIWDLKNRTRLAATGLRESAFNAAGITDDGRFAVLGGTEVQIWDLRSRRRIRSVKAGSGDASFWALSPEARYLAVGQDEQFEVFDTATGRRVHRGALAAVWPFKSKPTKAFSEFIRDRAVDFTVIYEKASSHLAQPTVLWRADWATGRANMFNDYMPSTGLAARIKDEDVEVLWAVEGSTQSILRGHKALVRKFAFSPDRWTIATGDDAGEVRVWDARSGKLLHRCLGIPGEIVSLSFSPDAQFLLASSSARVHVYAITP